MNVRRILEMGVDELASRGRQEASKMIERMRPSRRSFGEERLQLSGAGSETRRSERRRAATPARGSLAPGGFFAGASSDRTVALFRERFQEEEARILGEAESIAAGRFDLLGHRGLIFGDPIDWHLDPLSGRRAPLLHWSRLNPLDRLSVGDVKIVWELNRHQWLVPLGQAYRLSGEERFAAAAARYLGGWFRANPTGRGINWASSLEVALRLMSWCWAMVLLRGSRAWSPSFVEGLRGEMTAHANHVARYMSHHFSPNTHLTGEAMGLLYAGVFLPGKPMAGRWRRLASRILIQQIQRQILPDGVYFERATWYQRYTVETYLQFLVLAARNGIDVPAEVTERLLRSLEFLLTIRSPDGRLPEIGDGDGGFLLPLSRREPDDVRGLFSTAAALLHRADFAWAAAKAAPETLWLLGPRGVESFDALRPARPAASPSEMYVEGGFAVMRDSWNPDAHQMILDTGPIGCSATAGHGHADLLSIQCSIFGERFLVDPGTYTYTADPEWRNHFRSTAAHSALLVDGRGQASPAGPFSWTTRPGARLRRWYSGADVDFVDAEHDAYGSPGAPILHRRRVLYVKPEYWIMVDDVEGAGDHAIDLRFKFSASRVRVGVDHWVRARGASGHSLLLRVFSLARLSTSVREGSLSPREGWVSPRFGVRDPAPLVSYTGTAHLPLRIVTILKPAAEDGAPTPEAYPVIVDGPRLVGLVMGSARDFIGINEDGLVLKRD